VALKPVLLGTLAARITGVPLIVNAISGLGHVFASNSWLKHPLRFLLKIVLTSKHVHVIVQNPEDMHEIGPLALANHTHLLLGAGVNTDVFKPKEEPFCPPFVVSHVSRLLWSKGVGDLVEAARLLKQKGIPIHVQVVGLPDKENPNSIPEHVLNQWHGEGLIAWLGQQDNIEEIYQQSHVAVLASYYREGIPKSLLEALACGKPIVTCHMPGCRLTVQNGRNGFLIPPKSAEELARVLEILYKNPKKRQTMGKKSRSMALKYFSDHTIHKQTLRIYRANF
jgi:glycosyltransferase involved in cell wall biosynthesis